MCGFGKMLDEIKRKKWVKRQNIGGRVVVVFVKMELYFKK